MQVRPGPWDSPAVVSEIDILQGRLASDDLSSTGEFTRSAAAPLVNRQQ